VFVAVLECVFHKDTVDVIELFVAQVCMWKNEKLFTVHDYDL